MPADRAAATDGPIVPLAPSAIDVTPRRSRRKAKKRWFRRPFLVATLVLLSVVMVVGGVLAYRARSTLDAVHSVSTPPPEVSGAALGGEESLVIDTGPAQAAIEERREGSQPPQRVNDQVALTRGPTETASNVVPTDSIAASGGGPGRNTPPAFETESPLSPASGAETEPARSATSEPGTDDPVSSTSVPGTDSAAPATVGPDTQPPDPSTSAPGSETVLSAATSVELEPAASPPSGPPADTDGVNILLMGVDARDNESIDIGVRPDSLAVLHLEESGACRLLAIPRDSRAELPGYGQSKINHALAVGGIEYEMLVIEEYLGIELDHYGLIDFEGVTQVVDSVGGISVENPSAFEMGGQQFAQGQIELDGEQALLYARFRGTSEGDFGRISKQQQVLRALLDKAATDNPVKVIPQTFSLLTDHFRTDYGVTDLIDLARTYRSSCTSTSIETQTIPGDVMTLPDDMMQMDLSFVVSDFAVVQQNVDWLIGDDNATQGAHHFERSREISRRIDKS